jgi:cell division protein ZapA
MGQITVTIDGKAYRMACDDGQEEHLASLAAYFDARVQDMRKSFGEIGDMRLAVMASVTMADEVSELKKRLVIAQNELASARESIAAFDATVAAHDAEIAETVGQVADRVERIARNLAAG